MLQRFASASTTPNLVVHNGEVATGQMKHSSAKELLCVAPRGAYTTARTFGYERVFDLDMHIKRLQTSLSSIFHGELVNPCAPEDEAHFRHLVDVQVPQQVMENARMVFLEFSNEYPQISNRERALTVTMSLAKVPGVHPFELDTFVHLTLLKDIPRHPVKIHIHGAPRDNATAKDTEWVRARQALENLKPDDVNEIVLCDDVGNLYEGTQTNFFVVIDGTVYTAGEHVLAGTIRAEVLDICAQEGIPVQLSPPNVADIERWDEVFIASTSRLVLSVEFVGIPDTTVLNVRDAHDGPSGHVSMLAQRWIEKQQTVSQLLLQRVQDRLKSKSTQVV